MKTRFKVLRTITVIVFSFSVNSVNSESITNNNGINYKAELFADSVVSNKDDVQADKTIYRIIRNDKIEHIGYILNDDGREILLVTENLGKIYISKQNIFSIKKIENDTEIVRGEVYDAGPFTTRYSFTTNALPLRKGSNYAMVNLYGPEVHFALSDNFSLGIMTSWLGSPFVLVAKKSFNPKNKDSKTHFSIGTMLGTSGYFYNGRGFGGLHFISITTGDAKRNLTFSGGYTYFKAGSQDEGVHPFKHGPVFSVAGITKVGAKASFIFDSMLGYLNFYSYNNSGYYSTSTYQKNAAFFMLLMPGMRFQTKPNSAFQISIAGISVTQNENGTVDSNTFPLPMVSWFYKF